MSQTDRARSRRDDAGHVSGEHESRTSLVEGSEDDRRRLSIDFEEFTEKLRQTPALDHGRLQRLMAGADLINGLAGPPEASFGRAAPGVGKEADLSEQLGAITDESLAAAEELLQTAPVPEDDFELDQPQERIHTTELSLALSRLGNDEVSAARQALIRAKPATERAVAAEFI